MLLIYYIADLPLNIPVFVDVSLTVIVFSKIFSSDATTYNSTLYISLELFAVYGIIGFDRWELHWEVLWEWKVCVNYTGTDVFNERIFGLKSDDKKAQHLNKIFI